MRQDLTSYFGDFSDRGEAIAFAHRQELRTIRWSYRKVSEKAVAFAQLLREKGINKGDRVLLGGTDSPEWVACFFGCLLRGAVVVPLDVQSEPGFLTRVQQQVEASLAVLDSQSHHRFHLHLPVLPLEEIGTLSKSADCIESAESAKSPGDIAEIVFTSGTTAEPKGVVLTHGNLLANLQPLEKEIRPYLKWERLVHPIRFLNLLPLSHVFGQFMALFVPPLLGSEVFFTNSLKPTEIIETVRRERISVIVCVPRMLETLQQHVTKEYGASATPKRLENRFPEALRRAKKWSVPRRWWEFRRVHHLFGWKFWAFISGGATLSIDTEEFWQQLGFAVIQGYGMTETASLISVNHPFKKTARSIGAVMPGQEVKLGTNGEILVRGANVSPGYWGGETASDGWFHTGDLAELDAKGNLFFKGRQKDVIVTSAGLNVYPEDIEAILNSQPEIKTCTVVGIEGPRGPEPVAVLILRHAPQTNWDRATDQVIEHANQSLAEHQKIRRWFVWPDADFPRTSTQKVKKQLVAAGIKSAGGQPAAQRPSSPLAQLITRASGESVASLDSQARLGPDLKLDSLGRIELLSGIEDTYQLELDEAAFSEITTVADIERLIRQETPSETEVRHQTSKVSYPYPHWPHRWPFDWLRIAALYLIIFPLVRVMGRARVNGLEHLKNQKGPLLFVANHVTMVDHALVLWALPKRFRRRLSIAMDGELLREWIHPGAAAGPFVRLRSGVQYLLVTFFFNVFALPQHSGFRQSFRFAGEMVDRGYSLLVFPEGRRSPDGKLQTFRAGIGLLGKQLGIPVVPLYIEGLHELVKRRRHFAPKGAITVTISQPVTYSVEDAPDDVTADLFVQLKALEN